MEVFFDFACPYCYLAWSFLEKLNLGDGFRWVPWQIMPEVPEEGLKRNWSNLSTLRDLGSPAGVEFGNLTVAPNTQKALAAYLWAEDQGLGAKARRALFCAFFRYGLNISHEKVIQDAFASHGIADPQPSFENPGILKRLAQNDQRAQEVGVEVVPSFVEGGRVMLQWNTRFTFQDLKEAAEQWG